MVDGFKRLRAGRKLGYERSAGPGHARWQPAMKAAIIYLNTKARTIADIETCPGDPFAIPGGSFEPGRDRRAVESSQELCVPASRAGGKAQR